MKTKLRNEEKRINEHLKRYSDPTADSVSFKDAIQKQLIVVNVPYNNTEILYTFKLDAVETLGDHIDLHYSTKSFIDRDYTVELIVTHKGTHIKGYKLNEHKVCIWNKLIG